MRLLGIAASPRRNGNTERLLDAFLQGARQAEEVDKVVLTEFDIRPCQSCGRCARSGCCVLQDDMQMLYDKVLAADRIVIAAPIFFASVPAQLKAFIDRFQCFWVAKYVLKQPIVTRAEDRRGFFLCAAGMKNPRFFDHARAVVRVFFTVMNFSYQGSLFYPGIDWAGQIEQHPNALFEAQEAGKAFMQR